MKAFRWLLRREFWENRAIWCVPAAIACVLVLAALFGRVDVELGAFGPQSRGGGLLLFAFGIVFVLVMSIYTSWYLLDCLHAERKDRSILFWKSLPVSDAASVLSKLATALLVIPLVYFAATDMTTLLMAFILSIRAGSRLGNSLWRPDTWLQLQAFWLYLIATIAIWFLPVAGWLMLVSAWAKRAVMLWSILPPLALIWAERMFLGSRVLADWLSSRLFIGYVSTAFHGYPASNRMAAAIARDESFAAPASVWHLMNPLGFLASSATWIGAALGIALVVAAIQVRSRSTEIQ